MSKKINFGTINAESIETLSRFHVAHVELRKLNEWKKSEIEKVQKGIEEVKEARKKDMESGISADVAISNHSLEDWLIKQNNILSEYDEKSKPHKDAQKEALKMLPDNLYYAYVLAMRKGDLSASGTLTTKKGKNSVEIKVEKSLKNYIKDFSETIGCANTDNDTAMSKFAQTMSVRVSGNRVVNKGEAFVSEKSASQFNKLFMYNFLQYVIIEKGVVVINEDNTLSMRVYDETAE